MASVYKREGRKNWTIQWFDHNGQRRSKSSRTTDKKAAERLVAKIEAEALLRREGVVDVRQEALAQHGRGPLYAHVADYVQSKRDARRAARTVGDIEMVLGWLLETTGAKSLDDLNANVIAGALRQLRSDGRAPRTVNRYLSLIKTFLRWCVRMGRLGVNPADVLSPLEEDGDEGRKRRPLTIDEVSRLLEVAEGRGRRLWYMTALWAGLRLSELKALRWGDIDFEGGTLPVQGGKARRIDVLPLHPELAAELAGAKPQLVHPSAKVFPTAVNNATRQKDYVRAGIELVDDEDHHADLHSMRGTLATMLARHGAAPQITQVLMRHASHATTLKHYTRLQLSDSRGALEGLGSILPSAPQGSADQATGTDGDVGDRAEDDGPGCNIEASSERQHKRQQSEHETLRFGATRCESEGEPEPSECAPVLRALPAEPHQNPASQQKEGGSVDPNADRAILLGLEREQEGGMAKWLRRRIANP